MPTPSFFRDWVLDAMVRRDGPVPFAKICESLWFEHEQELRDMESLFFTWQRDAHRTLIRLQSEGVANRRGGSLELWELTSEQATHPFESLCRTATEIGWCWNLMCPTCGNPDLRYGLYHLSRGRHPDASDWALYRRDEAQEIQLGAICTFEDWEKRYKRRLSRILTSASLRNLSVQCEFPAWLGYLGVVLDMTSRDEDTSRALTTSWTKELASMVTNTPETEDELLAILREKRQLTWEDLAPVARSFGQAL